MIIRGARQVGKTWLMKEFGATCFEKTAYVNFDSNPRMQQVFDGEINVERILLAISVETGVSVKSEDTLLIFDEIQEVPKALSSWICIRLIFRNFCAPWEKNDLQNFCNPGIRR